MGLGRDAVDEQFACRMENMPLLLTDGYYRTQAVWICKKCGRKGVQNIRVPLYKEPKPGQMVSEKRDRPDDETMAQATLMALHRNHSPRCKAQSNPWVKPTIVRPS